VFGFEKLIWGLGVLGLEKKLGNFDLGKRFANGTVGMGLEGRRLDLEARETNPRQDACSVAQRTNPSQREHSGSTATRNPHPRPVLKGRSLGLGVC
jgi:hypothetical protein